MTTLTRVQGFWHGLTPSISGGGLADTLWGTSGTNYFISSIGRNGGYSLGCAPTATVRGCAGWNTASSAPQPVASFYVYVDIGPSSGLGDIAHFSLSAGAYFALALRASDNKFVLINFNTQTVLAVGPSYATGQFYLVDLRYDLSANPNWVYCKIDGGTEFSGSIAQASTFTNSFRAGNAGTAGPAYTCYFTDIVISETPADYPIGAHGVAGPRPNADGTHNNAPNIMEDPAGGDIDGSTIFAFDKEDENPWTTSPNTDYVRQTDIGTANYCEIQFADTAETVILGVEARLEYASAAATANNGGCIIRDSDGQETTLWGAPGALSDYSETTAFFKRARVLTPAGGWTQAHVNALRCRFGYSGDATPDPYWLALLIEVAYSTAAPAEPNPEAEWPEVDEAYDVKHDYDGWVEWQTPDNVEDFQPLAECPIIDEIYYEEHDYSGIQAQPLSEDVIELQFPQNELPIVDETYEIEYDYAGWSIWQVPDNVEDFQALPESTQIDETYDLEHDYSGWSIWQIPFNIEEPPPFPEETVIDEIYEVIYDFESFENWLTPENVEDPGVFPEETVIDDIYIEDSIHEGYVYWSTPDDIIEPYILPESTPIDETYDLEYDYGGFIYWQTPENVEDFQSLPELPIIDETYTEEHNYDGWISWITSEDIVEPYILPESTQIDETYAEEYDYSGFVTWQIPENIEPAFVIVEFPIIDEIYDVEYDYSGFILLPLSENIEDFQSLAALPEIDETFFEVYNYDGWIGWHMPIDVFVIPGRAIGGTSKIRMAVGANMNIGDASGGATNIGLASGGDEDNG